MKKQLKAIAIITITCLIHLLSTNNIYSQDKVNIAVAEFEGRHISSIDAVIIGDLLRAAIVKTNKFNVVDRTNMEKILAEQAFQMTGCTTQECAVRMGKLLNVNRIIVGNVTKLGKIYMINTSMINVETGKILRSEKVEAATLEELPRKTEYLAEKLTKDIIKKEKTIQKINKIGLGMGYPYISLIWNLNRRLNIEPRFATDFNEVYIAGCRGNYNFFIKNKISAYAGIGYDYLWFNLEEDYMSAGGFIAESYVGSAYKINKRIRFNMDIGPYYINITESNYNVKEHGWAIVCNIGIQIYLFEQ